MEDKFTLFELINNLESLDQAYITCIDCKGWLTKHFYKRSDKGFCCPACKTDENPPVNHDKPLEDLLSQMKYPCIFHECDHIDSQQNITTHMAMCVYRNITCPYCAKKDLSELTIIDHLVDKHDMHVTKLKVDDPVAELKIQPPFQEKKLFVASIKGNTFVIVCDNLAFGIGKQSIVSDFKRNCDKFMIQYRDEMFEARTRGNTVRVQDVLNANMKLSQLYLPPLDVDAPLHVKLYFNNYEDFQLVMQECPICLNIFNNEVHFCENDHAVCVTCKKKVTNCPQCAKPVSNQKVDLKRYLSQVPFMCPNWHSDHETGCIALVRHSDLDAHIPFCQYSQVKCFHCDMAFARCNIAEHISDQLTLYRNFATIRAILVDHKLANKDMYIHYKEQIFHLNVSMSTAARPGKENVSFYAQLLYDPLKIFQNYRYEVCILNKKNCFHRVGNVCQQDDDETASATVNWNFCKKVLGKENNEEVIYFRICLYEIL